MEITDFNEFFDVITGDGIIVVDFYAEYCGPCQQFLKIVPRLIEQLPEGVKFIKVNIDTLPDVKQVFEITKIPTFLIFKNGEVKFRQDGKIMTIQEIVTESSKLLTI